MSSQQVVIIFEPSKVLWINYSDPTLILAVRQANIWWEVDDAVCPTNSDYKKEGANIFVSKYLIINSG